MTAGCRFFVIFPYRAENRFSEAEFMAELPVHGIERLGRLGRILPNDIFIGIAKRT